MRARLDALASSLSRSPLGGFLRRLALLCGVAQRRLTRVLPAWVPFIGSRARSSAGSGLPTYVSAGGGGRGAKSSAAAGGDGHGLTGFSMREMRMMLKHFLSDRTSLRIFVFLCINFAFMFVELIYGWYSNSLGLISDAGHMLFDCTALGIGLYASFVSKLKPNHLYTYGYGRYEILSGYVNAVFLLFIGYFIFVESVERLFEPPEITSDSLVLVSALGLCVNLVGLAFFHDHGSHGHSHGPGGHGHSHGGSSAPAAAGANGTHGHSHGGSACSGSHGPSSAASSVADAQHNSNMFAIYLHILADTLGSVGVIISSFFVKYYNWTSADAICSIIISVLIVLSVLPLIRSTLDVLNQRTPVFKEAAIRQTLAAMTAPPEQGGVPGVLGYRHAHFWSFSDNDTIGTLHVCAADGVDEQALLARLTELWKESAAGVGNLTLQIEKEAFLAQTEPISQRTALLTGGRM